MTGRPDDLVAAYEASLGDDDRAAGAVYTPRPLADALVEVALAPGGVDGPPPTVCDPALGGGTFLLAAADALARRGVPPTDIVASCLWGADVDRGAVDVAVAALEAWLVEHEALDASAGRRDGARTGRPRPARSARRGAPERALASLRTHLVVADSLTTPPGEVWPGRPAAGFEVVVGNPPFQDQLTAATARPAAATAALRRRLGEVVAPYADTAALFLVAAVDLVRPGGRVVLIVPQSVLAARDAAPARAGVLARARLDGLWLSDGAVFPSAAVEVCAPVLTVAGEAVAPGVAPVVARWRGARAEAMGPATVATSELPGGAGSSWSFLASDLLGVPPSGLSAGGASNGPARRRPVGAPASGGHGGPAPTLGSLARATAGFRDQFYGVVPFVDEAPAAGQTDGGPPRRRRDVGPDRGAPVPDAVRLVTSGLIEPGRCEWGERPCRFAGRSWVRPVVDLAALRAADGTLARWAEHVLVPKVVLATQTPVLEAAVDRNGLWWPSVPVVAVVPEDAALVDRIAAVLLAPPVSAWAFERAAGSALSRTAVKLAARQVAGVPLPADEGAWSAAADRVPELAGDDPELARRALDDLGALMTRAYGSDGDVLAWWRDRLGRRRSGRRRRAAGPASSRSSIRPEGWGEVVD